MGKVIKDALLGNTPFWILTCVSIALVIAGFLCPPLAKIDNSVIIAVGELFGFGALWVAVKAIDKGVDATIQHNNTSLKINGDNQ